MNTKNATTNEKFFKALQYGALTSLLKSVHDNQVFDNNCDNKILQYIRNQSLSRDIYHNLYNEIKSKKILQDNENFLSNILSNFIGNTSSMFIGAFGYSNITENIFALGGLGGIVNFQVQKFLTKDATFLDFIFGIISTIEGINIAQNTSKKIYVEEVFDHITDNENTLMDW